MKKINEEISLEEIVKERINENKELFTDNDLKIINNNVNIIKRIYLLGIINGKQIYGKKLH